MERRAVVWLAQRIKKSITKLDEEDYWQNFLSVRLLLYLALQMRVSASSADHLMMNLPFTF